MKLTDLYSGLRPFSSDQEIILTIKKSKYYNEEEEDLAKVKKVQLLDTSKQRTYLISTGKRIYKILDDRRSDSPKVTWSRKIEKVFDGMEFKAKLVPRSERSYNLIFNTSPNRLNLVSKKLFSNIDFEDAISKLRVKNG